MINQPQFLHPVIRINLAWHSFAQVLLVAFVIGLISCTPNESVSVLFRTELGEIEIEVYPDLAPITASNFLAHVEQGDFINAKFYRVVRMDNQPQSNVKIEVIQGGLFDENLVSLYSSIEHETTETSGIKHSDGIVSMARNEPGTASTEFFICLGTQPSLDFGGDRNPDGQGFAAFGKVIRGMDVVRKIQMLPDSGQYLQKHVLIQEMIVVY